MDIKDLTKEMENHLKERQVVVSLKYGNNRGNEEQTHYLNNCSQHGLQPGYLMGGVKVDFKTGEDSRLDRFSGILVGAITIGNAFALHIKSISSNGDGADVSKLITPECIEYIMTTNEE